MPVAADVDLAEVARDARTERFSGADCSALAREAATVALKESLQKDQLAKEEAQARPPPSCILARFFPVSQYWLESATAAWSAQMWC